ncbi:hypothetical protein ACFL6X_04535 [Candidatus Latescibacterota bacterium]
MSSSPAGEPLLYRTIEVPAELTTTTCVKGRSIRFGGDVRLGNLRGGGQADFLVYRSVDVAHDEGGMKPCFVGAFTSQGQTLWSVGDGGDQPCRPGPVSVYDLDGDGRDEVICFFLNPAMEATSDSMANITVQVRDGRTGEVRHQAAPAELCSCRDKGPNWCHQRLLIANFRGNPRPRDLVVKMGAKVLALTDQLEVLWTYESPWTEYSRCPAYIPAVGDIDGDGCDEVLGGYYLLDEDGTPLWEQQLARHMDSVAIAPWDAGRMRAICSGYGHVVDAEGGVVLRLGEDAVPHGQEVRVAPFLADGRTQMVLRYNGHTPQVMVVDAEGTIVKRLDLNPTRNNTGMEPVFWDGPHRARLCNGGTLWDLADGSHVDLPGLPEAEPVGRMAWYHCIAADLCGDRREEVVLYNPWSTTIYVYSPQPLEETAFGGYCPGPRQHNARLMD